MQEGALYRQSIAKQRSPHSKKDPASNNNKLASSLFALFSKVLSCDTTCTVTYIFFWHSKIYINLYDLRTEARSMRASNMIFLRNSQSDLSWGLRERAVRDSSQVTLRNKIPSGGQIQRWRWWGNNPSCVLASNVDGPAATGRGR